MTQTYEPGTIITWTNKTTRRVAVRREDDAWDVTGGSLIKFTDSVVSGISGAEILDPLQLPWKAKYEGQVSANDVLKEYHKRNRDVLKKERDEALSRIQAAEERARAAVQAAQDIERSKDAEIEKLKQRLAAATSPGAKAPEEKVERAINLIVDRLLNMDI